MAYAGSSQNETYYSLTLNGSATAATHWTVVDGIPLSSFESFTMDAAGTAYWIDSPNNRVLKMTQAGVISTVAGSGSSTTSGDGGSPLYAGMTPEGVAVDGNGVVYILDAPLVNNSLAATVRRIKNGLIYTVAGGGSTAVPTNGNAISNSSATFTGRAFSVNAAGTSLYVSDSDNIYQITITN